MPGSIGDIHRQLAPYLVTGLSGTELMPEEREILTNAPPAGVILFHRNVEDMEQLLRLTGEVTALIEAASGLPPLIMADHEGGRISMLARAIGAPPSQMAAWKPHSEEFLYGITSYTAFMMRQCGINLTLSPVADVNTEPLNPVIGTRSFGEDPKSVSDAVRIAVRAISGEGMLSCLKHFPGHGATAFDSHLTLPAIGKTVDQLQEIELIPFIAGIEEGADTVMTAHLALSRDDLPASLDRRIVTGLLREKLGFNGVVITDALEMAGVLPDGIAMKSIDPSCSRQAGDAVPASIMAMALEAGNDLLLMSRPIEEVYSELARYAGELTGAFSGAALTVRMEESAPRIALARERAKASRDGDDPGSDLQNFIDHGRDAQVNEALLMRSTCFAAGNNGPGPVKRHLPLFLGTERDFDSYVVRRFVFTILRHLGEEGPIAGTGTFVDSIPALHAERPIGADELEPVLTRDGQESGLYIFEPVRSPSAGRSLVLLCRKPPPAEIIDDIASSCDSVVVAGRPWDVGLLPQDASFSITYGIYDRAAIHSAGLLRRGE